MAVRTIDKFQVMAQCVHIIQRQLRSTRNPKLRTALENASEHFGAIGRAEEYRMIVYANCIYLVHDDFKNEPNLKLSNDGKLYIGKLDICLRFNDPKCIRIHGDGTADCGYSMHGFMTGECITERVEYENGKEKRFCYDEQPLPPYLQDGARVNNDSSLGFFGRIRHNSTIGRKDFLLGLLSLLAVYYVALIFAALAGSIGAVLTVIVGVIIFVLLVMLVAKRIGDIGYFGGTRVALVLLTLFFPIMFVVLLFVPTKVLSDAEYEADKARWQKRVDEGERALARRCDTADADIDWFRITPEVKALADRLAGRTSGTPSPSYPNRYPDDDRAAEEEMRRRAEEEAERECMEHRRREEEERMRREEEERDREQRRDAIRREIDGLRSELSGEESKLSRARSEYDRAKQQADTYLSYARSTDSESIRRDYEQSAEGYLSDARSAERDMSDAERNIDDLRNRINYLESDMRSV